MKINRNFSGRGVILTPTQQRQSVEGNRTRPRYELRLEIFKLYYVMAL